MVVVIKKGSSKKEIQEALGKLKGSRKGFPAHKFTGKLKLAEDPVKIQRKLRNEWV